MNDLYAVFSIVLACVWTVLGALVVCLLYRVAKALERPVRPSYGPSAASAAPAKGYTGVQAPEPNQDEIRRINELLDKARAERSAAQARDEGVVEVHEGDTGQEVDLSVPIDRRTSIGLNRKP